MTPKQWKQLSEAEQAAIIAANKDKAVPQARNAGGWVPPETQPRSMAERITNALFSEPERPWYDGKRLDPKSHAIVLENEKRYPSDRSPSLFAQAGKAIGDTFFGAKDPKPLAPATDPVSWNQAMDKAAPKSSLFQRVATFPVGTPEPSLQDQKADVMLDVRDHKRKNPEAPLPRSIEERWKAIKDE